MSRSVDSGGCVVERPSNTSALSGVSTATEAEPAPQSRLGEALAHRQAEMRVRSSSDLHQTTKTLEIQISSSCLVRLWSGENDD